MDCRVKPGNDRFERVGLSLTAVMARLGIASQVYPTCGTNPGEPGGKPDLRCHPRFGGQTQKTWMPATSAGMNGHQGTRCAALIAREGSRRAGPGRLRLQCLSPG